MFKKINKSLRFGIILTISIFITLGFSISLQSLLASWTSPSDTPPYSNVGDLLIGGSLGVGANVGIDGKVGIGTAITATSKITMKALNNEEGLRVISSNYSPLVIRNTANTSDLFRVDQTGSLVAGIIPPVRVSDGLGLAQINETVFQQRVSSTCAAGNSIRAINQNGTVICETDDSGGGITGSGTTNYLSKWSTPTSLVNAGALYENYINGYSFLHSGPRIVLNRDGAGYSWLGAEGTMSTGQFEAIGFVSNSSGYVTDVAMRTGGAERLRINSLGNIGIGIPSPSYKLDVSGYVRGSSGLCIGYDCRSSWPTSGTNCGVTNVQFTSCSDNPGGLTWARRCTLTISNACGTRTSPTQMIVMKVGF